MFEKKRFLMDNTHAETTEIRRNFILDRMSIKANAVKISPQEHKNIFLSFWKLMSVCSLNLD